MWCHMTRTLHYIRSFILLVLPNRDTVNVESSLSLSTTGTTAQAQPLGLRNALEDVSLSHGLGLLT